MKTRLILAAVLVVASTAGVLAGEVIITPGAPQGWASNSDADGGTSVITGTLPRSGTGSLEHSLPNPNSSKTNHAVFSADLTYVAGEGYKAPGGGFGLLSALSANSFDWYRDSTSTAPAHLSPAFRLYIWDPDVGTHGTSYLVVWEGVYNGFPVAATDTWVVEDILGENFWRIPQFIDGVWAGIGYCNSNPTECFVFDNTVTEWAFGANTVVWGVEVGLGSGWNGTYQGFADNVTIGFSEPTIWNFELDAPVPGVSVLTMMGLIALLALGLFWISMRVRLDV